MSEGGITADQSMNTNMFRLGISLDYAFEDVKGLLISRLMLYN